MHEKSKPREGPPISTLGTSRHLNKPEATPRLNFTSINQLFFAITEKRLELIRHVASHEGLNIRQLAQALGRGYKNVYEDVSELCEYGLLEKDERGTLRAPYDQLVPICTRRGWLERGGQREHR